MVAVAKIAAIQMTRVNLDSPQYISGHGNRHISYPLSSCTMPSLLIMVKVTVLTNIMQPHAGPQ